MTIKAHRDDPSLGDLTELLNEMIEEKLEEDVIEKATINSYKKFIKSKVRKAAFKYLIIRKETHSKLNELEYSKLETQEYITSSIFTNEDVSTLFSLRSRSVECRKNFKNSYKENDLLCPLCEMECDSQQHMLRCSVLSKHLLSNNVSNDQIEYEDIFRSCRKQKEVTTLFKELIEIRKLIIEESKDDPSTCVQVLKNSYDLQYCIDDYSSGK